MSDEELADVSIARLFLQVRGKAVAEVLPKWTTAPPTRSGWYWLRNPGTPPHIVEVMHPVNAPLYFLSGSLHCSLRWLMENYPDSEWYGPLEEPK